MTPMKFCKNCCYHTTLLLYHPTKDKHACEKSHIPKFALFSVNLGLKNN